MIVSYKLLNNYVKVDDQDAYELAERITRIGHEVEGVDTLGKATKLVIGEVKTCEDHPDSDHLHVTTVDCGEDELRQIVCGAPNIAIGQKVLVALPGCELEGGKISSGKIRGVKSDGMICSLAELGLDKRLLREEDSAGIHVCGDDAVIGSDALAYLGLDDVIYDVGLTPNRSDCMAMTSFAYEVAALLKRDVKIPEIKKYDEKPSDLTVKVETELCPFFGAKLIKDVNTHESPEWLRRALIASGIKPINNVVDISNFVMVETGQPIHMYDYDKMVNKGFVIKTGFDCTETMLDGLDYKIEPSDIIVSTDDGIGCVGGVMGADRTKIDENSRNIVIEAATFDGPTLRATARRMNLLTDASQHFIKGALNTQNSLNVLDRCADLMVQLCDAKEVYETVHTPMPEDHRQVVTSVEKTNGLLGTSLSAQDIADVFDSLHFSYTLKDGSFTVDVPSYRNDITMAADLTEEVARLVGFDELPATLPEMSMTVGTLTDKQHKEALVTSVLVDLGLSETVSYTLVPENEVNDFNLFHSDDETVHLMSPLSEDHAVVRKSLIPSLLHTISYNNHHANKDVNIFELSNTYSAPEKEISVLAMACSGKYMDVPWIKTANVKADFYLLKGFVETLFNKLGIKENRYRLEKVGNDQKNFHPGRSACIYIGKTIVGVIGQIHPLMAKKYDVKETYVAELNLTELFAMRTSLMQYTSIPQYPSVTRDIALVLDRTVPVADVIRTIVRSGKILKSARVFDVYEGEGVEDGKKSVAISMMMQDDTKTLDDKSVNELVEQILERLKKEFNATLRS